MISKIKIVLIDYVVLELRNVPQVGWNRVI